jgi:energy-coupling factor transporter ATP-binding protein EcfA2
MLPYVVAAGLTVLVAGKVVSWICNVMTEEERENQRQERERSERIHACAQEEWARQDRQRSALWCQMGEEKSGLLLDAIASRRRGVAELPQALGDLERIIDEEAKNRTTSPYRKSVLRREYARIEDAITRMKEYTRYLDHEERHIQEDTRDGRFELLLERQLAEFLLPLEWLYPGRLVLVTLNEIDQCLPRFQHEITFGKKDAAQKALALQYGEEIPVLINGRHPHSQTKFYGCVARGVLYYHHIMTGEPAELTVEKVTGPNALGSLFGGLISANLPKAHIRHPGVRLLSGQKILVHPSQYDLCLRRDPFVPDSKRIEVSELNFEARSVQDYQQLYIAVEDELLREVTDEAFFNQGQPWTLLGYQSSDGTISLAKGTVRLNCRPRDDRQLLEVFDVKQTSSLLVGLDSPFRFTLIGSALARHEEVGWEYGVEEFLHFCAQAALDMNDSPERIAQGRFFQRWEQVIAYQRSREENFALEFPLNRVSRSENSITLHRQNLKSIDASENFTRVLEMLAEVQSDKNTLKEEHCVKLQQWDGARQDYIPAVKNDRRSRPVYSRTRDTITIEGDFSLLAENASMLRFLIAIPSTALKRQSQAMEDFFNDRLVNPALKNILLAPEHYLPESPKQILPIHWSGTLDDSQKRVVQLALNEKNIVLIQGPPGAGKTTAIVEMLYQLFKQQPTRRLLVVSQQNSAVDNALNKFLEKYGDGNGLAQPIRTIRIGNPEKMSVGIKPYGFDNQYGEFIEELKRHAMETAVRSPLPVSDLCYAWHASLQQARQTRLGSAIQEEFFITLLADRNLVGATCVGLANNKGGIDQLQFDVAIIDEAGRATVPEILIPILRSSKIILVGDHYQLPPSIAPLLREDEASEQLTFLRENFLSGSFFEMMFERLPAQCREILDKQYRMAPAIGDLVAEVFYSTDGRRTLFNGHLDSHFENRYLLEEGIYWVDVDGKQNRPKGSTSLENIQEAKEIARFLKVLSESVSTPTSVAVITAYSSQKLRINRQLQEIGWKNGTLGLLTIEVDTVDAFQGSEADVVCYSSVRTEGELNFILDRKRLNVACSRARLHLLFFGKSQHLRNWQPKGQGERNLFSQIMEYAKFKQIKFRSPRDMENPLPVSCASTD